MNESTTERIARAKTTEAVRMDKGSSPARAWAARNVLAGLAPALAADCEALIAENETLTTEVRLISDHRDKLIAERDADKRRADEAEAEVTRWQRSFDGHVYVTNEEYSALCRLRDSLRSLLSEARDTLKPFAKRVNALPVNGLDLSHYGQAARTLTKLNAIKSAMKQKT